MAEKISKQNKERFAVSLGRLANGFAQGIGGLLGFAANLERQGKSEHMERGEIRGKTKSDKEIKAVYDFRAKVGLNPEDFKNQKKLPRETIPQKREANK